MTFEKAYCCEDCGFLFVRTGAVGECPLCESHRIRPATEEETERLQQMLGDTAHKKLLCLAE